MPNRIIKESVCTSDSIDKLSWFEEVLFYRLIVNCDDYGRFDGRPSIIKSRLFPLKETLTTKTVSGAIKKLEIAGLVTLYVFEGRPYLYLPTWDHHQNVRAKKSKFPAPEDGLHTSEYICMQMQTDDSICSRNPIQSESESISESESEKRADAKTDDFDAFWAVYPRKVGKGDAKKAFAKVKAPVSVLIAAVNTQKQSQQWLKDNGQYIPNPATWLNQGRWEDELPTNEAAKGVVAHSEKASAQQLESLKEIYRKVKGEQR